MKVMIASDIHGSEYYLNKLLERFNEENFDKLLLLGDILYHGPRNDLPREYNPKGVIERLNKISDKVLSVRGNCESEVDQMVLDFPVMAEYAIVWVEGIELFLTHGHNIPDSVKRGIVLSGHTHIPVWNECEGYIHLNPGSVSIPKENSKHSYMTFDGKTFLWKDVETGEVYKELKI